MHIVFTCNEYPPTVAGGIGTAVATLARGLVRHGHRVSVIGLYPHESSVEEDAGVNVYRLERIRRNRLTGWFWERRKLRQRIWQLHNEQPIDIVEWPDFDGWWLKPIQGIVDVLKLHGGRISHSVHGFAPHATIEECLELRMMRRLKKWLGVSRWFTDEWRAFSGARPDIEEIVYNPVDTEIFRPCNNWDPRMVFYSGGLRVRKGVIALAEAARIFLTQNPGAQLVMATFESDVTKQKLLETAGPVARQIKFLPFMTQSELATHLARAAVFVMPSHYESCGNGWVESMACAVPVIASKLSCGPEIVADGTTGFLVDPTHPNEIADKVNCILNQPQLREMLGRAGRDRAMNLFSLETVVEKSIQFYGRCRGGQSF